MVSTRDYSFSPREEQSVPFWPTPSPPPSKEVRVYVVGMNVSKGRLSYCFVERPPFPDPSGDGPLEIQIPEDCTIVLRLSPDWNWEFRHFDAVMLGPMNYPEKPRYFNLVQKISNDRCMEVQFNALLLSGTEDPENCDPYALYINMDHEVAGIVNAVPLLLRIDPIMTNTGIRP